MIEHGPQILRVDVRAANHGDINTYEREGFIVMGPDQLIKPTIESDIAPQIRFPFFFLALKFKPRNLSKIQRTWQTFALSKTLSTAP